MLNILGYTANFLRDISKCINKEIGIDDVDFTLAKFFHSLYKNAEDRGSKDQRFKKFEDEVREKGGDGFPGGLIRQVFDIIYDDELKQQADIEKRDKIRHSSADLRPAGDKHTKLPNLNGTLGAHSTGNREDSSNKHVGNENTEPEISLGSIHVGYVSNIVPYGAFIRLHSPKSMISGLCHISQISYSKHERIRLVSDALKLNQKVFVKILENKKSETNSKRVTRDKISLSMRGIDQVTGLEKSEDWSKTDSRGRPENKVAFSNNQKKRRLTSPERWEIRQLISSGAISAEDYADILAENEDENEQESGSTAKQAEEDIDIELNDDEPGFLKGKTLSAVDFAPVKIIKNPEGSLGRVAMMGSKLVQDMREEKLKEKKAHERLKKKAAETDDPLLANFDSDEDTLVEEDTQKTISEWKKSQKDKNVSYGKRTNLSIQEQRESLPVFDMKNNIIKAVNENQFVVIVGETGSGKTTQIVQYLSESGYNEINNEHKIIGCTQPRRVAAISVASRVSEEVGSRVGDRVGYTVRFDDKTSPNTDIKYMTDGILEKEALYDPIMSRYSVIMLDEAHERTIATDVLFALLKKAAKSNPDLKVIVTSATLDAEKFSKFFNNCPILKVPGRTYPVEVLYTKKPELDYLAAALDTVMQIHVSEPRGDILVFLTGQEEIDNSCEILAERVKHLGDAIDELIILPVYSSLPSEIQSRIFEPTPHNSRKVIFATNIAETSITIDGIYYVVDPGFVKINAYDSKLGMDTLIVSPISQSQANQRSGRAGRTGPGKCYRLYTENAFNNEMLPNTVPEIQRQNLSHTILMLKAMGINDLMGFDFMDPPSTDTMVKALQDLYTLSALDDEGYLTDLGKKMADFPMEPALAKTLIISLEFGCSDEILTIVAMLSVQTIFYRPREKQKEADQKRSLFLHSQGDHLTLLNVYKSWALNGYSSKWCKENYIHDRSLKRALEVRKQLVTIMSKYKHPIVSCGVSLDKVRRALCAGFFKHSSKRDPQEGYKTLAEQTTVYMHPSSSLYGKSIEFVIYHTLLLTTKEYMHCVTVIDPKWLLELAPTFFRKTDPSKTSEKRKNQKIVPLFDKFAKDKDSWRLSSQPSLKRRAMGS